MRLTSGWGTGHPSIYHAADLDEEERRRLHGVGRMSGIESLTVNQQTTIAFTFEIGEQGIPEGGQLGVAWRWPLDWSSLQVDLPDDPGFLAVTPQHHECRYHRYSGIEPWHHYISIQITSPLNKGEHVQITCHNWRAPTCTAKSASFLLLIDPEGKRQWTRLLDPPPFEIHAGPASLLVLSGSSDVAGGEEQKLLLRAEDEWGNPTSLSGSPKVEINEDTVSLTPVNDRPVHHATYRFTKEGIFTARAYIPGSDLITESNPIRVRREAPEKRILWGDFHSGQTEIGCGLGSLTDHYLFGRDVAGLTFMTHQANDHYVTLDEWNHTREVTASLQQPGSFIPLLGCEWSALTPEGGDRNVAYFYDETRLRRSGRFFTESEPDPEPDLTHASEFLDAMKDKNVLINIHVGGRPTNLDFHEPAIERLAEIHSTHGTNEWFIYEVLDRGYQVGITAGTDGVMGRPGACQPGRRLIRNLPNGLTAVLATELTKDAIWEALQNRRCYATTGERILLDVDVEGNAMGSIVQTSQPPMMRIRVEGTAALERIDLFAGSELLSSWDLARPDENRIRVLWGGTRTRGTARAQTLVWDGSLRMENATLGALQSVGYFSADDELTIQDDFIQWRSATAGNVV